MLRKERYVVLVAFVFAVDFGVTRASDPPVPCAAKNISI